MTTGSGLGRLSSGHSYKNFPNEVKKEVCINKRKTFPLFVQDTVCFPCQLIMILIYLLTAIGLTPGGKVKWMELSGRNNIQMGKPRLILHLTFRHRASILGQAFRYSPENAFYIFNQQIYFII